MPVLFSSQSYAYLKERLMVDSPYAYEDGVIEVKTFPDGERYQKILTSVRNRDAVYVGGTINDEDTLELFDACCGIVAYGARSLTIVIPYYGYSTMERAKARSREVVTAKTRARILSAIPESYGKNRIVLFDLHVEGTMHYFGHSAHNIHATGDELVHDAVKKICNDLQAKHRNLQPSTDVVLASTDAGGAKRVERLAPLVGGLEVAFISKRRDSGSSTAITNINANVNGKHVIIYDDMTRSGSSLVQAAKAYKAHGALTVSAVLSHGVFTKPASVTYEMCDGHLDYIYCSDSHPRAVQIAAELNEGGKDFIRVLTCATVLNDAVIHHLPRGWGSNRD